MLDYKNLWSLEPEARELLSSTDSITKDRVLTVRVEESLYSLLEAYAEKIHTESVAKTVRTIISWFFISEVYRFELESMKPEKLSELVERRTEAGEAVSFDKFSQFIKELQKYAELLQEAQEKSASSLKFIEQEVQKVEQAVSMLEKVQETWNKLLEEKENNL